MKAPRFKRMLKGPAHLVAGPGPNQYFSDDDPRSFLYKRPVQPQFYQPATPKREHSKPKDEPVLPGPGTYEPSLLPEKPATKSVFLSETKRGFETIPNMNPGPGKNLYCCSFSYTGAYEAAHPGDYYESYSYAYPFSSTEPRREPFTPLKPIKFVVLGFFLFTTQERHQDQMLMMWLNLILTKNSSHRMNALFFSFQPSSRRPIKGNTIVPVQIPKDNIPAIPGPGAYDVAEPETKKKMQSAFVSATQRNYDDLTETLSHPGPGTPIKLINHVKIFQNVTNPGYNQNIPLFTLEHDGQRGCNFVSC